MHEVTKFEFVTVFLQGSHLKPFIILLSLNGDVVIFEATYDKGY